MQKSFSKQYVEKDTEFYTTEETVLKLIPYLDATKRYIEPFNRVGNSKIFSVLKQKGFDIIELQKDYDKSDDYDGRIIVTNPPFISRGGLYSKMSKQANEMFLIMPVFSFNAYTTHRAKDKCHRWTDKWNKKLLFPVKIFDTPTGKKQVYCVFTHWEKKCINERNQNVKVAK